MEARLRTITALLFAVILLLHSCARKPTEPLPPEKPKPNITGTWQGYGSKYGISYIVTATLRQEVSDTVVSGTGNIQALFVKIDFSVSGTNIYPDVRLTFENPDPNFGKGTYVGKFKQDDDNWMDGFASVPSFGLKDEPLIMKRTKTTE